MSDVTVTGGTNHGVVDLGFSVTNRAYLSAKSVFDAIADSFTHAPSQLFHEPGVTGSGEVISELDQVGNTETLSGFGAIVIQNSSGTSTVQGANTVYGGGSASGFNQSIVAGGGGLTFGIDPTLSGDSSTISLVALGGTDSISYVGNSGTTSTFLGDGNDTVVAGDGQTNVQAGRGANSLVGGSGGFSVQIDGTDTVQLGSGNATVYVDSIAGTQSVVVQGASTVTNAFGTTSDFSLLFQGQNAPNASTVLGGAGRYHILAGAGGGAFTGGAAGGNDIEGGTGAVSITGGGNSDFLLGGAGNDTINAGAGTGVIISGGAGANSIFAGSGSDLIGVDGTDTVRLGTGYAQINVDSAAGASVVVQGATTTPTQIGGFSLKFASTDNNTANTVLGGLGSYRIRSGAGGGVFAGGAGGGNDIEGSGGGAMSIVAGGDGDYLAGGSGNDTIRLAGGFETAVGGGGADSFVAGGGHNFIKVDGTDTVQLGVGLAIVSVASGSAFIQGVALAPTVTGYSLNFYGGANASTVLGGQGSYYIDAGAGGGTFTGGAGGDNYIFESGSAAVLITGGGGNDDALVGGSGNDTIFAGDGGFITGTGADIVQGVVDVSGGGGANSIIAGAGRDIINVAGADTVQLGTGLAIILVSSVAGASAVVRAATSSPAIGVSLEFTGGANASTVFGGEGRYSINAGAGGGVFTGGNVGQNIIFGTGAMTITGGGYGDFLQSGDTGNNLITAGVGKEILSAGHGNATLVGNLTSNASDSTSIDDYSFANIGTGGAAAHSYVIEGFKVEDFLTVSNSNTIESYATIGGSGTITLQDSTKIVLQNYAGPVTNTYTL